MCIPTIPPIRELDPSSDGTVAAITEPPIVEPDVDSSADAPA